MSVQASRPGGRRLTGAFLDPETTRFDHAIPETRETLEICETLRNLLETPVVVHFQHLARAPLQGAARNLIVLRGGMGSRQRRELGAQLAAIPPDEERLLIATGKFIGEGFDDARLDTLFLTMPVSWKGTLVQYAGRLHRALAGKSEVRVFDYVDRLVPMLARMFARREAGYRSMGYESGESPLAQGAHRQLVVEYDELVDIEAADGYRDIDDVS